MEVRNDYFNQYQSIISSNRGKRPVDFILPKSEEMPGLVCPFCPHNETETPLELGKILDSKGNWKIRWVLNKYPPFEESFGINIIIIETNDHKKQLGDFSEDEIFELFKVYQDIAKSYIDNGYKFPMLFKNFGILAGASRSHSHSQGAIYKEFPPHILNLSNITQFNNICRICGIIEQETNNTREIIKKNDVIAFCPLAPRFNNEVWILPIKHINGWSEFNDDLLKNFSSVVLSILRPIQRLGWHYNLYFEFGSSDHPLHFSCKILPRLNTWAAIEIGAHNYIVSISPEESAQFYKSNL